MFHVFKRTQQNIVTIQSNRLYHLQMFSSCYSGRRLSVTWKSFEIAQITTFYFNVSRSNLDSKWAESYVKFVYGLMKFLFRKRIFFSRIAYTYFRGVTNNSMYTYFSQDRKTFFRLCLLNYAYPFVKTLLRHWC